MGDIFRHVVIALDASDAAEQLDFNDTKLNNMKKALKSFISPFSNDNPLSRLAIIAIHDGVAHSIASFNGT